MLRSFARQIKRAVVEAKKEPPSIDPEVIEAANLTVYPKNEEIQVSGKITVVDWQSRVIGRTTVSKAITYAKSLKLDAVLVEPSPPVVKLMDYPLYLATQTSKKYMRTYREHNFAIKKTFPIRTKIDKHDFNVKMWRVRNALYKYGHVHVEIEETDPDNGLGVARHLAKEVLRSLQCSDKWEQIQSTQTEKGNLIGLDLKYDRGLDQLLEKTKHTLEKSEKSDTSSVVLKRLNRRLSKLSEEPQSKSQELLLQKIDDAIQNLTVNSYSKEKLLDFVDEMQPEEIYNPITASRLEQFLLDIEKEKQLVEKVGVREAYNIMANNQDS